VTRISALVSARAGRYERANAMLDHVVLAANEELVSETRKLVGAAERAGQGAARAENPAVRLQLRATELSMLEAWGRAFDVLAPAVGEIKQAPEFAVGFAELAFRAGEFEVARDVLAARMTEQETERTTAAWSKKMGWTPTSN
jgi:hypothetical protein